MGRIFERAKQYVDQLDPDYVGQFVEIGTSRNGDDGSTPTIAAWAAEHGRTLWTIDMDLVNCEFVKSLNIANIEIVNDLGEEWLRSFPAHMTTISVLYLDNFDWDWHPDKTASLAPLEFAPNGRPVVGVPGNAVLEQKYTYQILGMPEMNNINSQRAHLLQAELALPALGDKCLVICDDTWYNKYWGHYSGKSGSVVPYLMNHGFEVLYTEEAPVYGTILGRGIK